MWKVLNKEVDLGEPTSFLDHVHWGRTMSESRSSAGGREITIPSKSSHFLRGPMTWLVMQRSVWNDIVS